MEDNVAETTPTFHYEIAMPDPGRHLFEVTFTATGPLPDDVDVRMPVWSPGSYLVREYARNVQDLTVTAPDGRALPFEKVEKNVWRIGRAADGPSSSTWASVSGINPTCR